MLIHARNVVFLHHLLTLLAVLLKPLLVSVGDLSDLICSLKCGTWPYSFIVENVAHIGLSLNFIVEVVFRFNKYKSLAAFPFFDSNLSRVILEIT